MAASTIRPRAGKDGDSGRRTPRALPSMWRAARGPRARWSSSSCGRTRSRGETSGGKDEREAVARRPRAVEVFEAELSPAAVAPETEHIAAPEEAEPRIVEEDDGPLQLNARMLDAEVQSILVGRPLEATFRRKRNDLGRG